MDRWDAHNTTRLGAVFLDTTAVDARCRLPYVRGGQLLRVEFMLSDIPQAGATTSDDRIRVLQGSTQVQLAELTFPLGSVDGDSISQDFPERPGVLNNDWIELLFMDSMNAAYRVDAAVYILRLGNPAPITVPEDGPPIPPPE